MDEASIIRDLAMLLVRHAEFSFNGTLSKSILIDYEGQQMQRDLKISEIERNTYALVVYVDPDTCEFRLLHYRYLFEASNMT